MTGPKATPVRRPRYPMPAEICRTLMAAGVMTKYRQRPPYQRNDYNVSRTGRVAFKSTRGAAGR